MYNIKKLKEIYEANGKPDMRMKPQLYYLLSRSLPLRCHVCGASFVVGYNRIFFINYKEQPTIDDVISLCAHCYGTVVGDDSPQHTYTWYSELQNRSQNELIEKLE